MTQPTSPARPTIVNIAFWLVLVGAVLLLSGGLLGLSVAFSAEDAVFGKNTSADAVQTLYSAVLTPFVLPILTTSILTDVQAAFRKPVQNMLNVIDTAITSPSGAGWVLAAGFPLLAVMSDVVTATGDGLQNIVNGLNARNLAAVVNAIVAMPGAITGAVLNGYNGDGAGILGPNGIVQGLRNALGIIATAIKPVAPPPVAAASVPSPAPTMVALSTATPTAKPAVETKSLAAVSTVSAEKAASDKTAAGKTAPVAESGATTTAAAGADVDSAPAKTPASDNAGSSASAADGDGAAAPSAPATKPDHPTPGAKPSSGDAGGAEASTAGGAKGADASTTSTRKGATKPKRGAGKAKGADSSASDSGSGSGRSHDSAGKTRGAGKGTDLRVQGASGSGEVRMALRIDVHRNRGDPSTGGGGALGLRGLCQLREYCAQGSQGHRADMRICQRH